MNFLLLFYALCSASISSVLSEPLVIGGNKANVNSSSFVTSSGGGEGGGTGAGHTRRKRSVFHLVQMMTCAVPCNPLDYKGYGCYCGFLGSGVVVDGIDKCCKGHDWCYENARCKGIDHYFAPYKWKCNGGSPYCVTRKGPLGAPNSCGHQLCECDREFVECLKQYPCPKRRAVCMTSPWRNSFLFTKLGRGAAIVLQTIL
ncbi:acidic phospholipase A2 E-like isoform X2 [Palaemon carinicauda]|uniref:acidic phospholipase A2 E-like isoform X2 n=1 Tax=Palaemon carinicauda TaxID=392227 RepID=UPI0035B5DDAE